MTDDELVAELVSRAVASTIETLFANQARSDLFGFALGTDDDVCAIHPFACPSAWLLQEQVGNADLRYTFTDWIALNGSAFADVADCLQRFSARDYGDSPRSVSDGSPLWGRARDSRFAAIATGLLHCRQRGLFAPETLLMVGSTDPSDHMEALEESFLPLLNTPEAVRGWRQWRLEGALTRLRKVQARPAPLSYAEQDSIEGLQVEVQRFQALLKP
jgi:hypothetical protein